MTTKLNYRQLKMRAMNNIATSDRLKHAIAIFEQADSLDAQLDAVYLAKLMQLRATEALGKQRG